MSWLKLKGPLVFLVLIASPMWAAGQSMSVFGGNNKAQECFQNANLADQVELVRGLLAPCDYALEYVALSTSDAAATRANRGIILTNTRQFEKALKDFAVALELRPETGQIYINRGNVYFYQQDFTNAIADYTRAVDLGVAEIHVAYLDRAMAHDRIGNTLMAEEDYRQALKFQPQWQLAKNLLSRLLSKQESEP